MGSGKCVKTFNTESPVLNVASSDCGTLGVATTKKSYHLIDYKCERSKLLHFNNSNDESTTIDTISISQNGKYLITGLSTGEITTYDMTTESTLPPIKSKDDRVK